MPDEAPKESGIAAAVRQRHDEMRRAIAAEMAVPAQLPLLPLEGEAASDASTAEGADDGDEPRGRGRPPGSKNRRTKEWVEYILAKYPSPLEALASTYARPVELLAAELSCSRQDAYKIQQNAAAQLAPYIHQKQPMAVQIDGKGLVQLIIHGVDDADAVAMLDDDSMIIEGTVESGAAGSDPEGEGR